MDRRDFIKLAAASVAGVAAAKWLVDLPGPPDVHDGNWHHLVITRSNDGAPQYFVDGAPVNRLPPGTCALNRDGVLTLVGYSAPIGRVPDFTVEAWTNGRRGGPRAIDTRVTLGVNRYPDSAAIDTRPAPAFEW